MNASVTPVPIRSTEPVAGTRRASERLERAQAPGDQGYTSMIATGTVAKAAASGRLLATPTFA